MNDGNLIDKNEWGGQVLNNDRDIYRNGDKCI